MTHVFAVAEVGSNFNGSLDTAKKYVQASKEARADAVKFQTLLKEKLVAPRIMAEGKWIENPVVKAFSNLGLPEPWHADLKKAADSAGIEFFSTPFYLEAVALLERVGVRTYKVASGDITFIPLLEAIGRTRKNVIMSTGASSIGDVERALNTLTNAGASKVTLLHCVSNYPPQFGEMNLRAMVTLKEKFGVPVGLSDHTPGSVTAIAAVALGATVIEKHVTFDRSQAGPDHPFAMTMPEFGEMVRQIRLLEQALGTGEKAPVQTEQAKQYRIRRGVYDPVTFDPVQGTIGVWLRPEHTHSLEITRPT